MEASLSDLRERVLSARGPDGKLDALLWGLYDARPLVEVGDDWWGKQDPNDAVAYDGPPAFTGSIDLALALVERICPKSCVSVTMWAANEDGPAHVECGVAVLAHEYDLTTGNADAPTPPLAILAALLSALIANAKGET